MTEHQLLPEHDPELKQDNSEPVTEEAPPYRPYATWTIIILNGLVFLLMLLAGIDFMKPNPMDLLKWGGNLSVLTFSGDAWRLVTSLFLHAGMLHLVLNMYALYFIGSLLEPQLGRGRFLLAYLGAGIIASLTSAWWYDDKMIVCVGASGAIMGLYGLFLSLITMRKISHPRRLQLLQSVAVLVLYNVFQGLKPETNIDNAAHIGGVAAGILIGYCYAFMLKRPSVRKTNLLVTALIIVIAGATVAVLKQNSQPPVEINYETGTLFNKEEKQRDEDAEKFLRVMVHFSILEEMALDATRPSDTLSREEYLKGLRKTALTNWAECVNLMDESATLKLPLYLQNKRTDLRDYANHRIGETRLRILANEEQTTRYDHRLDSIQQIIDQVLDKIDEEKVPLHDPEQRDL